MRYKLLTNGEDSNLDALLSTVIAHFIRHE